MLLSHRSLCVHACMCVYMCIYSVCVSACILHINISFILLHNNYHKHSGSGIWIQVICVINLGFYKAAINMSARAVVSSEA